MSQSSNTYSKLLNSFFQENREKSLRFLLYKYPTLSLEDSEDIYQEASVILYTKITNGELGTLDCSLYTYFLSICINLALKQISRQSKFSELPINSFHEFYTENIREDKMEELDAIVSLSEDEDNNEYTDWIEQQICECVRNMKPPCNHILQSFYWDGFNHKTIAELYGMKNEDVCKTQANRCRNKFKEYIKKLISSYGK